MQEDRLEELLEQCDPNSPLEPELLGKLYPHLRADHACALRAQYTIDYSDMDVTIPDFAFPDMKIAIYCDGFKPREGNREQFRKDRLQSRELQLRKWIVLRFAGREINFDSEMVVDTIQQAIDLRDKQRTQPTEQIQKLRHWKYATLGLGIGLALSFVMVLMLLFKPLDSKAYIERGKAKADKGQHFEAISDYDMGISLNPDNARAYYHRGLAKEKIDRGRGREDLQKALKLAEKAKAWDLHRTIKQKIKLLAFLESLPPIPDD